MKDILKKFGLIISVLFAATICSIAIPVAYFFNYLSLCWTEYKDLVKEVVIDIKEIIETGNLT